LLRKQCSDLSLPINEQDQELINRMVSYIDYGYETKEKHPKVRIGIAIAGPQVGLLKNIIYIHCKVNKDEYRYLLMNPKIVGESITYAYLSKGEGCLSVEKDVPGIIKRRNKIIVKAYDLLNNKDIEIKAEGILAICLQHEIDHLSGVLYYDHINKEHPNAVDRSWIEY
jgi:peptide deformylase